MDRLHFFFSFELSYLRTPKKPRLAGHPEDATQLAQKPLAVLNSCLTDSPQPSGTIFAGGLQLRKLPWERMTTRRLG